MAEETVRTVPADAEKAAGTTDAALNNVKPDGGAPAEVPRHIAVIPDGNRRWARKRMLPAVAGHKAGVEAFRKLMAHCTDIGVKYVTFYAFSTENWKRSQAEVGALMKLLLEKLLDVDKQMGSYRNKVRFLISGDRSGLSPELNKAIEETEKKTEANKDLIAVICINYGGRDELVHAVRKLAHKVKEGGLDPENIDEEAISSSLYEQVPDPDLIIRTSGEQRLSNFLLWQSAYSELYFSDLLWPDFDDDELDKAVNAYSSRKRRYGK